MNPARSRTSPIRPRAERPRGPEGAIRLLVLDVDGVLTDGRLYYGPRGEQLKCFHVRDGHGIKAVRKAGIEVAVISGRRSAAVARRCRELGIAHVIQGAGDKLAALTRLLATLRLTPRDCACVGDDVPDAPILRAAGLSYAVADAHPAARAAATHSTSARGGRGAVREVCDRLLAGAPSSDAARSRGRASSRSRRVPLPVPAPAASRRARRPA